ncbi:MAG: SEC-C metal-binding domain-containing protein, partial [Planctomycetota bacterium]
TAMTEADEFWKIYKLDVVAIPTNRGLLRIEHRDLIYLTEKDKFRAIADDVERTHKWDVLVLKDDSEIWGKIQSEDDDQIHIIPKDAKAADVVRKDQVSSVERSSRPVLVGTVSIEKSERLSALLERRGIKHDVLNAKQHGREADIVSQAGRLGAVTIATNMAGRGTDIILGGNPETKAWAELQHQYPTRLEVPDEQWNALVEKIDNDEKMSEEGVVVRDLGGLYVIGTERHESRRIDLQLRGRCGRQGDPGSSRFFLSLEDDLMRIFAGDFVKSMMERMGMKEGEAIESSVVTNRIAAAQKKVEERNFEIRKSLLEYDEVMDEQRKRGYRYRQSLLDGHRSRTMVLELIRNEIDKHVDVFLDPNYGCETFAAFAGTQLQCQLEAKDFQSMDFEMAETYAKDQAERASEVTVAEAVEENLPEGMEDEWNWQAITSWSNTRLKTNYQEHQLKKRDREDMVDELVLKAHGLIEKTDLSEGRGLLDADYGMRVLCGWMRHKFGIETTPDEFKEVEDRRDVSETLVQRATSAYTEKENEYPVLTGIAKFTTKQGSQVQLDREGLIQWVRGRFRRDIASDEVKLNRDDLKAQLVLYSAEAASQSGAMQSKAGAKVEDLFGDADDDTTAGLASGGTDKLDQLAAWLCDELGHDTTSEDLSRLNRSEMHLVVDGAVDDRFYPEMRRMERQILLNIVDDSWKNHLLTMDHLRSSVGLKGYAQMDPKVEYKREGMRLFETMWESIGERVTDLIFRMESFNDEFVRSTWVDGQAIHADATTVSRETESASDTPAQRAAAGSERDTTAKAEPIRSTEPRIGRNSPCPCGSGKKYKSCCMRKTA